MIQTDFNTVKTNFNQNTVLASAELGPAQPQLVFYKCVEYSISELYIPGASLYAKLFNTWFSLLFILRMETARMVTR